MSTPPTQPRFVPTLTDVVPPAAAAAASADRKPASLAQLEGQMVNRIMRQVDLVLERRLREAVGQVILEHTQTLAPRLREEIELVIRESVSQAMATELSSRAIVD